MADVPALPLGRVTGSMATDDGSHILIRTEQAPGVEQVFALQEDQASLLIQAIAEGHMQCRRRRGVPPEQRDMHPVRWWEISVNPQSNLVALSLTIGPAARLDFALPDPIPRQILETLQVHLGQSIPQKPSTPPN